MTERKTWVDMLRGFSMMAILWFHTEMYYAETDVTPYACYVGDVLATFFFISGYLFKTRRPFQARQRVLSVLKRLTVPYFIFMTLMVVPKAVAHGQMDELPVMALEILTGEASWFVTALILSQLFFIALLWAAKGRQGAVALFGLTGLVLAAVVGNYYSPYFNPWNYWHVNESFLGCFLLAAGYLYHCHEPSVHRLNTVPVLGLLAVAVVLTKVFILHRGYEMVLGPIITTCFPLFVIDLLLCMTLLVGMFKRLPAFAPVQWTGSHSLVYYFICGGVPLMVAMLLNRVGLPCQGYLTILLAFALVYPLSTLLVYVIYRWFPLLICQRKTVAVLALLLVCGGMRAVDKGEIEALGLPVLLIETIDGEEPTCERINAPTGAFGNGITNTNKVPGRVVLTENGDTVFDSGDYVKEVSGMTIKIRGNSSAYYYDKKPYKIKLEKKNDLLLRGDSAYYDRHWVLIKDGDNRLKTLVGNLINEAIGMDYTPAYRYVNVIFNGDYRGIYMLTENVRRNADCRINVQKEGGYLIERDAYWWNEKLYFPTAMKMEYTFKYPDEDDITDRQREYIEQVVADMEQSITDGSYPDQIDVESFAAWMLAHDILGTYDSGGANIFLTKYDSTADTKLCMSTLWDFDSCFQTPDNWARIHYDTFYYYPYLFNNVNTAFAEAYVRLWDRLSPTIFDAVIDSLRTFQSSPTAKYMQQSRQKDYRRWNTRYYSVNQNINEAINWFNSRRQWLHTAINQLRATMSIRPTSVSPQSSPQYRPDGVRAGKATRGIRIVKGKKLFF